MTDFRGTARFAVRGRVGAGGMGVVYRAFDRERGTLVALKTLRHLDPKALYRFKSEFRALADLVHPNVVRLGELFGEDDDWFFTMELLDGCDFLTYVRNLELDAAPSADSATTDVLTGHQPSFENAQTDVSEFAVSMPAEPGSLARVSADEPRLRVSLRQLAQAIAALHEAQKLHRDIKPSNVRVTSTGRVVLLDLGLVTDLGRRDPMESASHIVGTAAYMAPEQAAAAAIGPAADWYSMGAILYEALTGQPPFSGGKLDVLVKKQSYEPPPPRSLVPDLPRDLDELCVALLHRDPRDRPDADQILERLGANAKVSPLRSGTATTTGHEAPFVGRELELESLRASFAEAEEGLPISTVVLGESGMGKSALVLRFLDQIAAQRPDAVILKGRCHERESVPFKAFDDVVDSLAAYLARIDQVEAALLLPRDSPMLARVFPVLRRVPALARATAARIPDLQELRARAFAALRELLSKLAQKRPLALFIDDLQWADADSLALFTAIMHGIEAPPLFFVATARTSAEEVATASLPAALAEIQNVPGDLRRLPLGALSVEESRTLAARLLGSIDEGSHHVGAITREGGGHPMFIHELVRHFEATAGDSSEVRLDDALWSRIRLLDPPSRRLLELVAVSGEPVDQRIVMHAASLEPAELERVVGVLRVASLVRTGAPTHDTIEPYHDRVRESVVARLAPEALTELHARLANVIEASTAPGTDTQALVRHLEAAGLASRAAEHAARAARQAAETLAFERAAAMYAKALHLGVHDDAVARQLRTEMADALVNAGRGTAAAEAYLAAAEGADATTRLECRRKAAGHLLITGEIERGLAELEGVLAELDRHLPRTPGRALISLLWNRARLRLRGLGFTPRHESDISRRELNLIDTYHAVGVGLALVDTMRGADFQSRGLLLALRSGERQRVVRGLGLYAGILASQGPRANRRSMKVLSRCEKILGDTSDPYLQGWVAGSTGLVHYLGGRFSEGIGYMLQSEVQLRDETAGNIWELNTVRVYRLMALRALGRWGEMRRGLDECMRDAARRGDNYAQTTIALSCNLTWVIAGELARAEREIESRRWSPPEGGYHIQHWYGHRARIELALYRGDLDAARHVLDQALEQLRRSFLLRVQTIRAEATWLDGRIALAYAASGAPQQDLVDKAADAARRLAKEGVAYARVWGALLDAGVAARRRDGDAARESLERSAALAEEQDMRMCVAVCYYAMGHAWGEELMSDEGVARPELVAAMLLPGV